MLKMQTETLFYACLLCGPDYGIIKSEFSYPAHIHMSEVAPFLATSLLLCRNPSFVSLSLSYIFVWVAFMQNSCLHL